MSQTADDLLAAAEIIQRRGWCQGALQKADGSVCLVGALRLASDGSVNRYGSTRVADAIGALDLPRFAAYYNDDPTTTAEDVILLLKTTAERLR